MATMIYGIDDPELARKIVEEYRKARFSGTEEGLKRAEQILQEIRSGRYLKPIDWPVSEEEVEGAKREFFVPEGGKTLDQAETWDEEEALREFYTAADMPVPEVETPRPATRYSYPERTSLVEPRAVRYSYPERTSLTEPSPTPRPKPAASSTLSEARRRAAVSRIAQQGKTRVTPPPGTPGPRVMSMPQRTALTEAPPRGPIQNVILRILDWLRPKNPSQEEIRRIQEYWGRWGR